ncbi:MAG TPA: hypothetical protein DEA78_05090 [Cyanobacteria bacterium UBA11159]|nr:hypothetical protein [Cyanobacteria bacterium UBA11367]HBE57644.1 hypothetical protein [Cyanobacteria bacterium UBA11366]HBK63603.1 hypothetical protein [Cyanobacteria bacterium UBA11166]HBR73099.1 hypothetical protein [Cyanobacteria bacterium UBA11159]
MVTGSWFIVAGYWLLVQVGRNNPPVASREKGEGRRGEKTTVKPLSVVGNFCRAGLVTGYWSMVSRHLWKPGFHLDRVSFEIIFGNVYYTSPEFVSYPDRTRI